MECLFLSDARTIVVGQSSVIRDLSVFVFYQRISPVIGAAFSGTVALRASARPFRVNWGKIRSQLRLGCNRGSPGCFGDPSLAGPIGSFQASRRGPEAGSARAHRRALDSIDGFGTAGVRRRVGVAVFLWFPGVQDLVPQDVRGFRGAFGVSRGPKAN